MPVMRVIGRMLPEVLKITIPNIPSATFTVDFGQSCHFQTTIINSVVTVDCEAERFNTENEQVAVMKGAYNVARSAIDLMAFIEGIRLDYIEDTVILPGGQPRSLVNADLSRRVPELQSEKDFKWALNFVLFGYRPLSMALRDLNEAQGHMRGPENAGRVVDAIRAYFVQKGETADAGWAPMRSNLRLSKEYLQFVTKNARSARHGDYAHGVDPIPSYETIKRAATVMRRFFEYQKRGCQPLPESEFVLLD